MKIITIDNCQNCPLKHKRTSPDLHFEKWVCPYTNFTAYPFTIPKECKLKDEREYRFVKEYETLCRQHGLMVVSDGEPVKLAETDKDLWGLLKSDDD